MAYRVCGSCGTKSLGTAKECSGCGEPFKASKADAGTLDHAGRRFLEVGGEKVSVTCAWNDHGATCKDYGTQSDSTNGMGPWYCKHHWRELHGRNDPVKPKLSVVPT